VDVTPPRRREGTALSLTADGALIIHYVLCPQETVRGVSVVVPEGQVVGDEDDRRLWAISSDEGSVLSQFRVGATPEGFVEEVPLRNALPPNSELAVVMETTFYPHAWAVFRITELHTSQVLWKGETISPEDFEERAEERCP
jgi:hypothetical protein